MADQLYLSLWFPNFRLESLPSALVSVMRQFGTISEKTGAQDAKRVSAATAYPISFSEAPTYQRLYVTDDRAEDTSDSIIETAVAEATEQLHDDVAYEFEMKWKLWTPDSGPGSAGYRSDQSDESEPSLEARLDVLWRPQIATVKIIGFGPGFDDSSFEQNGHVRVDFGLDYPWVLDEEDVDMGRSPEPEPTNLLSFRTPGSSAQSSPGDEAVAYIQKNVEVLLAFTLSVEKHCGISSRLLWTESGEPLAEKLIARLQRLN